MADEFTYREDCRMCGSTGLLLDLKLSALPIGDRYLPEEKKSMTNKQFPLDIMRCGDCGHYQNSGYINPDLIYEHYLSRPATTNPVLSGAYQEYAEYLLTQFKTEGQAFSIETGSNDGAFSKYMQDKGAKVLCVEPAPNLVEQANANGIPTKQAYFSEALAKEIRAEQGAADYFIANHMFSNVNDSEDFIKGVHAVLADTGVFSMQTFYHVDVIAKNLVENYTHEHLSCFYIKPYQKFLARFDMELFDVKRVPAKAGSIRCFAQKKGGPRKVESSVAELIALEEKMGLGTPEGQASVKAFIEHTRQKLHDLLEPEVKAGKTVAGFGTSIGATTFMYNYDLGDIVNFFVDDDPYRHNLVSPGLHIPVLPSKAIYDKKPDYVIVMAPLYADIIIDKNRDYLKQGGKFVKFWPEFEIVSE